LAAVERLGEKITVALFSQNLASSFTFYDEFGSFIDVGSGACQIRIFFILDDPSRFDVKHPNV